MCVPVRLLPLDMCMCGVVPWHARAAPGLRQYLGWFVQSSTGSRASINDYDLQQEHGVGFVQQFCRPAMLCQHADLRPDPGGGGAATCDSIRYMPSACLI